MPGYKISQIRRALEVKLQATTDDKRAHIVFFVYDGPTLVGRTFVSHGASEISDSLMGIMAKQMAVPKRFWVDLCRCNHDRAQYLKQVEP